MPLSTSKRRALPVGAALLLVAVLAAFGVATSNGNDSTAASGAPPASTAPSDTGDGASAEGDLADRPNIVLISTDDMTYSDLRWMPVVRRLLTDQGVSYDRALSAHPLCCPARAAILTGQYAQNNGVKSNQAPYNYEAFQQDTALPVWLQNAGYRTAFTGKYLNGFGTNGPRQPGWDWWDPTMIGQYAYTPFQMYNNGDPQWYPHINNVDYINERVTTLVDEWAGSDRPFFIWASQVAPHGAHVGSGSDLDSAAQALPPERYANAFPRAQSPSLDDPAYAESDVSDKNAIVRSKDVAPRDKVNEIFRSRIRSLQAVDDGVEQLVAELRETGELDDTYIMFTSDNGFLLGEHNLITKNVPYRQSLRVPLVIRGPGIPAGEVRRQYAEMIDLAPTIADIAGATPLVRVDGVSLLGSLTADDPLRNTILIQAGPSKQTDDGGAGWWWRGVTTDRYTYADFYGEGLVELYDHLRDPAETTNVSGDPRYAGVESELRRRLELLSPCAGPAACSRPFARPPNPDNGPGSETGDDPATPDP